MSGLSLSDILTSQVDMTPTGGGVRNFGNLLILGDSDVIDTVQRERLYTGLAAIGADFGAASPEYKAAMLAFGQTPTLQQCYVGRWASTATAGRLSGGALSTAQQALSVFTSVITGSLDLTIDGTAKAVTGIDLAAVTTLNGVAAAVQTALTGSATVTWNPAYSNFVVKSSTTGAASAVSFSTPPATGTDLGPLMGLTQATSGAYTVAGALAETIEEGVTLHAALSNSWYGLQIAATAAISDADYVNVATIIQGLSTSRIFGVTTSEASALDPASSTDLASLMQTAALSRTFVQYSSTNPYASAGIFGRAFTVDFTGINTTITLMFQSEAGVVAENLSETAAAALKAKNCNVFAAYQNGIAIVQYGTMANGYYFDEIHGADWLQNALQTDMFNALYSAGTKVPQTDSGVNVLVTAATKDLKQARDNGFIAPGVWTGPPIGAIQTGQTLTKGFYLYAPPISSQTQTQRSARTAPTLQAAIKLAGAIHIGGIIVNVNR